MKNFKNYTIVFLLGLITPMILGYLYEVPGLNFNPFQSSSSDSEEQLAGTKRKIQNLYDDEVREYLRLKSLEAKYSKANDLLAKMMTIFLADLGLRIQKGDIVAMMTESQAEFPTPDQSSPSRSCPEKSTPRACPSLSEMARDAGYNLMPKKNPLEITWVKNESHLEQVTSESEENDFLRKVSIEDFFSEIRKAKSVGLELWKKFDGRFEGVVKFDDPERAPADATIEIEYYLKDSVPQGDYKITLTRDGKPFSSSSGNGANILKGNQYSKAVFLDLGGKSGYLQLYFVGSQNVLIGNYYRQSDVGSFKKEGTAKLYRR